MRFQRLLLLIAFFLVPVFLFAQKKEDYKQPRILILLDGSSSMTRPWEAGQQRFQAAEHIILALMDSIYQVNKDVEFGLRVYGHQHGVPENNCFDTKREIMFSKENSTQMALRLEDIHPQGVSPIAYSLKVAAEMDFDNERDYSYSLILVTDGGESCGGNICEVVKNLLEKKISFKPYIVSLVDYEPLKGQYDCLGNYLKISKSGEISPVLHTITENYRKVLAIPIAKPKLLQASQIITPSVLKIDIPRTRIPPREKDEPATVVPKPVVKKDTVVPPPVKPAPAPEPRINKAPSGGRMVVDTNQYKREKLSSLPRRRFIYLQAHYFAIREPDRKKIPLLRIPPREQVATTPPAVPPTNKTTMTPPPSKKEVEASYTSNVEPSSETTLQVFFTNGKGKFYHTNPKILLKDPATKQVVQKFFRTTDASGNPDPQKIPAGTYEIGFESKSNLVVKKVVVKEHENTKITIVVTNGSIKFEYRGNPDRPVSEFSATVKRNFEYTPVVTQKCTELIEYEPGNYHVEILNILPPTRRTLDVDFGGTTLVPLEEPGFVQFTNTNNIGRVNLFYPAGDQYLRFYAMDVNGNPEKQNLRLQPGTYQTHYKKDPKIPYQDDIIQTFVVKSNQTTSVEIQ